jgi:hypothetical protein
MNAATQMSAFELCIQSFVAVILLSASTHAFGQTAAQQHSEAEIASFTGCYELQIGRWWPWGMGADASFVTPPSHIELDRKRGTAGFEKDELLIREFPPIQRSRGGSWWVPPEAPMKYCRSGRTVSQE